MRINFFAQYQLADIEKALVQTKGYAKQLYILIQLALREYIGTLTLDELLAKKEQTKELVTATDKDILKAFSSPDDTQKIINDSRAKVEEYKKDQDLSTDKGRKQIAQYHQR